MDKLIDFNDPERYKYIDLTVGYATSMMQFICSYCIHENGNYVISSWSPVKESEVSSGDTCRHCKRALRGLYG